MNLQDYLGDLYPIFCSYRREDTYSNSNFVSDGLDNVQMIERAKQFWELAQKEIKKVSNGKCTITASLYNLLVIPAFKPLVEYFELGNRIRVKVDSVLYTLMLIGFSLNFGDLNTIEITFSTATKVKTQRSERDSILESAKQMATSYDYVQKQAEKAKEIDTTMKSIVQNGLDSSLVVIKNNENEEVTQGKFGILLREKDDVTGGYSPKQSRLTHNSLIYTDSNWATAKCALGEHTYSYYDPKTNTIKQATGYGLTADFVQANTSMFSPQIIAGDLYSEDYDSANSVGSHIGLKGTGNFQFGRKLSFDGTNLELSGKITVESGYIGSDEYDYQWLIGNDTDRAYIYNGTDSMISTVIGTYLGTDGYRNYQSDEAYTNIQNGILKCNGAEFSGSITGSEISGSKFITKSDDDYEHVEIKNGNMSFYDNYGVSWLQTNGQTLTFRQPNYDDNDNPLYSSYPVATMRTSFHDVYDNYENSPPYSLNIGMSHYSCFTIGYGNAYGDIGMSNVLFAINYKGDNGIDICGSLRTLDIECSSLTVNGTQKSRLVSTENYNDRLLYCYEMPSPMFGDLGEGQTDETGKCYIFLDDIFAETIDTDCIYQVFLQPYGKGECYVTERTSSYFVVEGTENLYFGWEIKAIQIENDTTRLEEHQKTETT